MAIRRVSTSSTDGQGNLESKLADVSGNGNIVVFQSLASNLTGNDADATYDLFAKNLATGVTTLITANASGNAVGVAAGQSPGITNDGRLVAFAAPASLIGGSAGQIEAFVKNLATGAVTLASSNAGGTSIGGNSFGHVSISDDGRYVAFSAATAETVSGRPFGVKDVYIKDLGTGALQRIDISAQGTLGNQDSYNAVISGNGQYVAFESLASNLIASDTNNVSDVFVWSRSTGQVTRASVSNGGAQGSSASIMPSISADGHYIAFDSSSAFVSDDTNSNHDIFVRDIFANTTVRASTTASGGQAGGGSLGFDISADGRYLIYETGNEFLFGSQDFITSKIVVKDLVSGALTRVTVNGSGSFVDGVYASPKISGDDKTIVFQGDHTTLVAGDTNNSNDVYAATGLGAGTAVHLSDINADGNDDVVFQNGINGQVLFARMVNGVLQNWGFDTTPMGAGGDWKAVASGNVNPTAAGGAEVFVQQQSTGNIVYASVDTGNTTWGVVSNALTSDWKLRAVADLNGDASVDAIVQNQTNGTTYYADMKGGTFQKWGVVNQNLTPDWVAVGAGDLNHDGYADVVVQNQTSGTTYYASMARGQFSGWGVVSTTLTADWKVKAVADVTGDGFADVVFQNSTGGSGVNPGTTYFADVSTGAVRWGVVTTSVSADWVVEGTADVDNDGLQEVLFQNLVGGNGISPGTTYHANVGPAGFEGWGLVAGSITADWHVV